MRTRRSWRNQNRLWKELCGPQPETPQFDEIAYLEKAIASPAVRHKKALIAQLERARARAAIAKATGES